jgi:hypothetical protein
VGTEVAFFEAISFEGYGVYKGVLKFSTAECSPAAPGVQSRPNSCPG